MFNVNGSSMIRKMSAILVLASLSILTILTVPENSDVQIFLFFLLGCVMGYPQGNFDTRLDVILYYCTIFLFFVFYFFLIPNKMQSILFLLGALIAINIKKDFMHSQ